MGGGIAKLQTATLEHLLRKADRVIPLTLSSPSAGATLGGDGSTTLVIHDNNPPPLVTMTNARDITNKKHQVTEVLITYSGAVNAAEADNPAIYRLAVPGKKGSFTAKNAKVIKLKSVVYNAVTDTVTLIPSKPFALTKPVQLQVNGLPPSGLQDSAGRYIDGDHNGTPGGNAVAVITKHGATIDAVSSGTAAVQTIAMSAIVDALFDRDEVVGLFSAHRDRRGMSRTR
jgi:hypothetical protein